MVEIILLAVFGWTFTSLMAFSAIIAADRLFYKYGWIESSERIQPINKKEIIFVFGILGPISLLMAIISISYVLFE